MFRDFLESLFSQIIPQHHRRKIVVFLDKSSVHRSNLIEEHCQKYEIKMISNAPYCPDFNPISVVLFSDHSIIGKFTLGLKFGSGTHNNKKNA
jgi:hypothetical protein